MNKSINNLQEVFLNGARKNKIPVTIYLNDGTNVNGKVVGFDSFTIILDSDGIQLLIYKHSISLIEPSTQILFTQEKKYSQ